MTDAIAEARDVPRLSSTHRVRSPLVHPSIRWLPALGALALFACEGEGATAPAQTARAAATVVATAVCAEDDPHAKHLEVGFRCETCHPCGGEFGPSGTLPGGTPVTGTITRGSPTTCAVSCHSPSGAPIQTVAWNQGPLTCVSCHTRTLVADARSAHADGADRAACLVCHEATAHLSGVVKLNVGDGTPGNTACLSCHSGAGKAIGGQAPPVVVEFGVGGSDPHGEGGVEPARGCGDCHDTHASTSAFLLGNRGDPTPLAAKAIESRAGMGAEALCERCHPARHRSCSLVCHVHDDWGARIVHISDPAPAGAPCFACHGHEGVIRGDPRRAVVEYRGFFDPTSCNHCHRKTENLPPLESTPPDVTTPVVSNDGIATATVTWSSNEPATTYVEYGDAGATDVNVIGDARFQLKHTVQIPSLSGRRPQQIRIRTSDRMRNVALTATDVLAIGAPSTPVPGWVPDVVTCAATVSVRLSWSRAADPNGDGLVYEFEISDTPRFETLVGTGTTPVDTTTHTVSLHATYRNESRNYYWRVRAREAGPEGLASTWSAVDWFSLYVTDC